MKKLVIRRGEMVKNLTALREKLGGARLRVDLSHGAFGLGLLECAEVLADHGVTNFAVSEAKDGEKLRKNGFLEQEILFLPSVTEEETLERLMDQNILASIGSSEAGMALNSLALKRSTVAEARVAVDCGAGDGGFLAQDHDKVLSCYQNLQNVAISGLFATIPGGKGLISPAGAALGALGELLDFLHENSVETGILGGKGEITKQTLETLDEVTLTAGELLELGCCESRIQEIRWLPKGHTVCAGRMKKLRRPGRFATIPVGELDGMPRKSGRFGGKMTVKIGDKRAKVFAVFPDISLVNITDLRCKTGDLVQFDLSPLSAPTMEREYRP